MRKGLEAMQSVSKNTDRLIHGPILRVLITFSFPFMISTLLQTLYSTIDTIVVGQYLGSVGLSAVTNGSQIMQIISMFCIGFTGAGQVLIAQYAGAGNKKELPPLLGTMFCLVIGISIFFTVIGIFACSLFLSLLNTPEEAMAGARSYVLICCAGLLFTGLYNAFSSVFIALGDSKSPLYFVLVASVINLVLDLVFITAFHWDVAGAALATILGQLSSVLFSA